MKVFESGNRIYDRYEALLLKVCPEISRLLLEKGSVFELPQLKKFLNDVIIDGNDVTYQEVKLMRRDAAKQSLQNNVLSYFEEILMSLFSPFRALTEDDTY